MDKALSSSPTPSNNTNMEIILKEGDLEKLDAHFNLLCLQRNRLAFDMIWARKDLRLASASKYSWQVYKMDTHIAHLRWLLLIDYIQPALDVYSLNGPQREFAKTLQAYKSKLEDRKNLWSEFNSPFNESFEGERMLIDCGLFDPETDPIPRCQSTAGCNQDEKPSAEKIKIEIIKIITDKLDSVKQLENDDSDVINLQDPTSSNAMLVDIFEDNVLDNVYMWQTKVFLPKDKKITATDHGGTTYFSSPCRLHLHDTESIPLHLMQYSGFDGIFGHFKGKYKYPKRRFNSTTLSTADVQRLARRITAKNKEAISNFHRDEHKKKNASSKGKCKSPQGGVYKGN